MFLFTPVKLERAKYRLDMKARPAFVRLIVV